MITRKTASILIVTSGKGNSEKKELVPGKVFFVPADQEFKLSSEEDMEIFQAFVNIWVNYEYMEFAAINCDSESKLLFLI